MKSRAEIGVLGGSGFYRLFDEAKPVDVDTEYGSPSGPLTLAQVAGRAVAFLPRHGVHHEYPPHMVPYRANLQAFKDLGVARVLGPCAVGSLKPEIRPGDLVFCDQFVNFTSGRKDTFYDGPLTTHVSTAHPYCPEMREAGMVAARKLRMRVHQRGCVVVVQGPRFSTAAESRFFRSQGWDVINMTQYPEVALARELGLCYMNVSVVTDYDAGLEDDRRIKPVSQLEVVRVFNENTQRLKALIMETIARLPETRGCDCGTSLDRTRLSSS